MCVCVCGCVWLLQPVRQSHPCLTLFLRLSTRAISCGQFHVVNDNMRVFPKELPWSFVWEVLVSMTYHTYTSYLYFNLCHSNDWALKIEEKWLECECSPWSFCIQSPVSGFESSFFFFLLTTLDYFIFPNEVKTGWVFTAYNAACAVNKNEVLLLKCFPVTGEATPQKHTLMQLNATWWKVRDNRIV